MTDNKNENCVVRLNAIFDFQCFGLKLWIIPLLLHCTGLLEQRGTDKEQQCL